MPIAVMPGLFVAILVVGRDELVEYLGQVALQPWLKFNRPDTARATDIEDMSNSCLNVAPLDDLRDMRGNILHVPMASRFNLELFLISQDRSQG